MDAITTVPRPVNERNLSYAPGSAERVALEAALKELQTTQHDLTATIGGEKVNGGGTEIPVVQPHNHRHVLGVLRNSTRQPDPPVGHHRDGRFPLRRGEE